VIKMVDLNAPVQATQYQPTQYSDIVMKTQEILNQPINWNDLPQAGLQILNKLLSLASLGLPVIVVLFLETWFIERFIIEKYVGWSGILAWGVSLLVVLLFVMPATVAILLPFVADVLASIGVTG